MWQHNNKNLLGYDTDQYARIEQFKKSVYKCYRSKRPHMQKIGHIPV